MLGAWTESEPRRFASADVERASASWASASSAMQAVSLRRMRDASARRCEIHASEQLELETGPAAFRPDGEKIPPSSPHAPTTHDGIGGTRMAATRTPP